MQTCTGRVVDGKVVVDGDSPPDGTEVTVQVAGKEDEVWVTPDMEAELEAAIERIDRGQFVAWEDVKDRLKKIEARMHRAHDEVGPSALRNMLGDVESVPR